MKWKVGHPSPPTCFQKKTTVAVAAGPSVAIPSVAGPSAIAAPSITSTPTKRDVTAVVAIVDYIAGHGAPALAPPVIIISSDDDDNEIDWEALAEEYKLEVLCVN